MAKEIDKIIKSPIPPKDTNVLWDNGENLKIYRNGKWENTNTTEIKENSIPFNALSPLNDTDKNQALSNLGIADLLEALKPVQLLSPPPIGNVTQEQLDKIGLTEKVINNIVNGYTDKIRFYDNTFHVIWAHGNAEESSFVFISFYFDNDGKVYACSQYRYHKGPDFLNIELVEV